MKLSFKHTLFICLSFFFYSVSFAQLSDTSKVISLSAQELYFNRSENEEKISSDLFYMVVHFLKETYKGQSVQKVITELKKDEFSTFDDQNRLLVFIRLKSNSKSDETQLVNLINNSGGEVYHQEVGHNNLSEITAYLPIQEIIKIADNEKTALIKKPIPILFHIYKSLGDEQLKAQQVRQLFNVNGSNIKIGVINDGADKWSQAYAANELPMISIIRNGSGDEGTAMMEIIHDLAPSSELIFAGVKGLLFPVNWAFLAGLVNELHYTRECNIIVDDFYTPEEPFFSDEGLLGEAIRNFINDGGVYITAAGNSRKSLYSGVTSLGNGYHIFPDGNDYLEFVLEGSDYLYLQWSTSWTNPSLDLDFEALNTTTNTTYYSSSNQSYTTPPIENLDLTEPGVYRLKVKKRAGLETVEFKILSVRDNNIPNNNTKQIFGHSAYPNVISVAAYQANNQNTTSDYSSIGPALMYSTAIGQWTVQEVPTITATSGVETWVGSTGLWSGGYPVFDGTSASAPHIAGLAALYFHKLNVIENFNKSNMDFRNDLTLSATTLEIGTGGIWNNKSGFGKADILAAINRSLQTVATPVITPPGGIHPAPPPALEITISCETPDAAIYYTEDGSVPKGPPQINGTLYQNPFTIDSDRIIKAKAFKTGYNESGLATEIYNFGTIQEVATVSPVSGVYPVPLTVTISWSSGGYECWETVSWDNTVPPDPQIAGNNAIRVWRNPSGTEIPYVTLYKLKVQLKKDGQWGPVVYVQYDIRPTLRIAQIDDEITQGNNSFGEWYKWEDNNHWAAHLDETIVRPTQTSDWFIKASQEFKDPDVFRKYNVWTTNQGTNYFVNHAKIPIGPNTSSVLAHFKETYNVTVMNKLENSFSVN
ncbi:Subtilisin-like serine protease [Ignavibacterium album JCM 16511]|uniref:Subtilisin-like serine protease n=1 Tax=Ignavibacterium album (strain DSM 19864 / JCM 16511 / NBRC 101810 / Mat9-16) TaxID=945713 RepID=I0ANU0_IGNAJ|nr:FN3 associated domain-containing protein [Ignavibacterium album]AFH50647.1 Subtilisin-like serine protease [Ignavibacterium album JCM 16511]